MYLRVLNCSPFQSCKARLSYSIQQYTKKGYIRGYLSWLTASHDSLTGNTERNIMSNRCRTWLPHRSFPSVETWHVSCRVLFLAFSLWWNSRTATHNYTCATFSSAMSDAQSVLNALTLLVAKVVGSNSVDILYFHWDCRFLSSQM